LVLKAASIGIFSISRKSNKSFPKIVPVRKKISILSLDLRGGGMTRAIFPGKVLAKLQHEVEIVYCPYEEFRRCPIGS